MDQNLGVRYTDVEYLSKKGLRAAMRLSSIDGIWANVESYRAQYRVSLAPFTTISNQPFYLTLTPTITKKIEDAYQALSRLALRHKEAVASNKELIGRKLLLPSLLAIRDLEDIKVSELALKAMTNNRYAEGDPTARILLNYIEAVKRYSLSDSISSDEDALADYYLTLLGGGELISFYRTSDTKSGLYMNGLDYAYEHGAPSSAIEPLMNKMYEGLVSSNLSPFIKAVLGLFYFDIVKPFDKYSKEVGALFASSLLASSGLAGSAFYLPLLPYIKNNATKRYQMAQEESQKTGDATYVVLLAVDILTPLANSLLSEFNSLEREGLSSEFNHLDAEEEKIAQERGLYNEPKMVYQEPVAPVIKEPEVKIEEPEVSLTEPEVEAIEPVAPTPIIEKPSVPQVEAKEMSKVPLINESAISKKALSNAPEALSDKEAKEYAKYLLETNPNLTKGQARFYATHCTMGRYYVIQQYKKYNRCAYETARTSMDKLASEGYYQKMALKNKFVYTPIRQGEK